MMTDADAVKTLESLAARLLQQEWKLERVLNLLPEGRTRDVVEAALLSVRKTKASLDAESQALTRYAEPRAAGLDYTMLAEDDEAPRHGGGDPDADCRCGDDDSAYHAPTEFVEATRLARAARRERDRTIPKLAADLERAHRREHGWKPKKRRS